jgi:RNA polymerase sigma factor (TIGR02999 family)
VEDGGRQHLVMVLYDQLRALARSRMNGQRMSHTLDPTSLANEAVVRLLKCDPSQIRDEQHFLAMAAEAMRQVLVDHARAKATQKRGDGSRALSLSDPAPFAAAAERMKLRADPIDVLALNDAITSLEADDPDAATIVKMRSFAGMDCEQIAALLNVSKRTIERRWRYAVAELRTRMAGADQDANQSMDQDTQPSE